MNPYATPFVFKGSINADEGIRAIIVQDSVFLY